MSADWMCPFMGDCKLAFDFAEARGPAAGQYEGVEGRVRYDARAFGRERIQSLIEGFYGVLNYCADWLTRSIEDAAGGYVYRPMGWRSAAGLMRDRKRVSRGSRSYVYSGVHPTHARLIGI